MKTWNIIKKDVRILLSDKKTMVILVLMPIILMTILGAGLSGGFEIGTIVEKYKIGIVKEYNENDSNIFESLPFSDQMEIDLDDIDFDIDELIFEDVLMSDDITELFIYEIYSREEGLKALKTGEIKNLVIFPKDFVKDTYINLITPFRNEIEIEIIADPNNYIETSITRAVFGGFQNYLNHMVTAKNIFIEVALKEGLGYEALENLEMLYDAFDENFDEGVKFQYKSIDAVKMINSAEYYSIAMLSMFILFTGGQGGRMMLEEKQQFTFQRMKLSGISKWQIFLGKFVTVFIVGVIQVFIMILYTSFILKVDWGNWLNLVVITFFALLAIASMGTMISTITLRMGNYKVANVMETFIFQIMAFLGGSFVPVEMLPNVFSKISYFTINGLTLKAYLLNMQGYSILEYRSLLGILLGITALFISIGIAIMNQEKRWRNVEHYTPADA